MSDHANTLNTKPTESFFLTLVSCTACWFLAQMSYYAQAQMLGPIMSQYSLGEIDVGIMFTQELTVYALAALFVAGPLSKISRVKAALLGAVVLIIVNLISAFSDSFEVLRVTRLVAGFAGGLIGAAGTASAASSLNPQRVFAIVGVCWGLIAAVQVAVVPYLTVPFGAAGGYFGMVGAVVVLLPLIMWLNPPPAQQAAVKNDALEETLSLFERFTERLGVRDAPNARFALLAMVGLFIYEIGQGATQMFLEQFGLRTGLDEVAVGHVLGVSGFLGLSGGLLATWLGNRFGSLRPIIIGIIFNAIFASALALGTDSFIFAASYLGWNMAYYFLVPYMLGLLALMDDRGRWAVAADAVWWIGAAPGAAVGGILVQTGGYSALAALAPIGGIGCIIILGYTLRKFNASQDQQPPSAMPLAVARS